MPNHESLTDLRLHLSCEGVAMLDGRWLGTWSGYRVRWKQGGHTYEGTASDGVRGIVPVVVIVKDGRAVVERASAKQT